MERPGARDHHAAGADDAFLERADDGHVDGMAHPEIVGVDEQQAGTGGVSQKAVRSEGIPCVHRHLAPLPESATTQTQAPRNLGSTYTAPFIPGESRSEFGTLKAGGVRGYAELRRTPFRRTAQNAPTCS